MLRYKVVFQSNPIKNSLTCLVSTVPPTLKLEDFKDNIVLKEGQSIAIEIPYSANPQPKINWQFNSGPVPVSRNLTVDTIRNMTSLSIGHAEAENEGKYTVNLVNPYGKESLTLKVTVLCKLLVYAPPCK